MKVAHRVTLELFGKDGAPSLLDPLVPVPAQELMAACEARQDPDRPARLLYDHKQSGCWVVETRGEFPVIHYSFKKRRDTSAFFKKLKALLPVTEYRRLVAERDERLNVECDFSVRLGTAPLKEGKLRLTDSPPCVQVKISVAAYPKSRENALKVLEDAL